MTDLLINTIHYAEIHLYSLCISILLGLFFALPLILLGAQSKRLSKALHWLSDLIHHTPPLALIVLIFAWQQSQQVESIYLLALLSATCIISETLTGLAQTPKNILFSGQCLGMSKNTLLYRIQFPLALPDIIAGVRLAALTNLSVITLTSFFDKRGLGALIQQGLSTHQYDRLYASGITLMILTVVLNTCLSYLHQKSQSVFFMKRCKRALPVMIGFLLLGTLLHNLVPGTNY